MRYQNVLFGSMALLASASAVGHGLVSEPASRNWFCGAITKPDTAEPGSACAQAFEDDFNGGYQFMSVLTHDLGRKGVSPLPTNVCGFDSETWNGGATPWDKPIDWPTNQISAGEQTFTWDISWGPHFDDTEEFVYYITKPGFDYQVGEPLSWDDFESEPFCDLTGYDDSNPSATPNIVPEKGESLFHTTCTVPEREGRHVIYAEWGRNYFTYERFHGCIDVEFGGGNGGPDPVVASINANPGNSVFAGAGTIELSAANSQGSNLSYNWSVEPGDDATYNLSGTSGVSTTLTLADTDVENDVTVRLQVSNSDGSDSADYIFTHVPSTGTSWEAIGPLTNEAQTLSEGDEVQLRLVTNDGEDVYLPTNPLVISSDTTTASAWSYALANEINSENTDVRVGVLNDNGDVEAVNSATENRVFAQVPANYTGAYLQIERQSSSSSSSSSSEPTTGQQCNWYGTNTPLCDNQDSGWGYENGQSCVGATTCSAQPDPYGIIGGGDSSSSQSSSVASSVSSSVASSSAPSGGNCEYVIQNQWNGGFTASIVITNDGASAINGWDVSWDYSGNTQVTNSWNAEVSGSGPYTASDMGWNGTIQPGESVEFGFQGSGAADVPEVTGSVCN